MKGKNMKDKGISRRDFMGRTAAAAADNKAAAAAAAHRQQPGEIFAVECRD